MSAIYREHELKCCPKFFNALLCGDKTFEARRNDRDFSIGDRLYLREWSPEMKAYTGRAIRYVVTYILTDPEFGIQPGWCVMSIQVASPRTP